MPPVQQHPLLVNPIPPNPSTSNTSTSLALTVFHKSDTSTQPQPRNPASKLTTADDAQGSAPPKSTFVSNVLAVVQPSFAHIFKRITHWGEMRESERVLLIKEGNLFLGNMDAERLGMMQALVAIKVKGVVRERIVHRRTQERPFSSQQVVEGCAYVGSMK